MPLCLLKGIRFADAIIEREPLIAHVSQSETVQFACGKREVHKPVERLKAGEFRALRSAARDLPSTRNPFEKGLTENFHFGFTIMELGDGVPILIPSEIPLMPL